jgi:hypothetical protein
MQTANVRAEQREQQNKQIYRTVTYTSKVEVDENQMRSVNKKITGDKNQVREDEKFIKMDIKR